MSLSDSTSNFGRCVVCGNSFRDDSEIMFGDEGRLCSSCMEKVEARAGAQVRWKRKVTLGIVLPPVFGIIQFFPMIIAESYFYGITIAALATGLWAFWLAFVPKATPTRIGNSSASRLGLLTSGTVGVLLAALCLLFFVLFAAP